MAQLLPFMFQCVQSGDGAAGARLGIFAQLWYRSRGPCRPPRHPAQRVRPEPAEPNVDIGTPRQATCSFISSLEKKSERDKSAMAPSMLNCLGTALNQGDEATAQETLGMFIEIGEEHQTFLRKNLTRL